MSTGMECEIIELEEDGRSFYILESGSGFRMSDWLDSYPHVGGPFPDPDAAWAALSERHANPGGYSIETMTVDELLTDPVRSALISKALGRPLERSAPPETPVEVAHILFSGWNRLVFPGASIQRTFPENSERHPEDRVREPAQFDVTLEGGLSGEILISAMRNATGTDFRMDVSDESWKHHEGLRPLIAWMIERTRKIYPEDEISIRKEIAAPEGPAHDPGFEP